MFPVFDPFSIIFQSIDLSTVTRIKLDSTTFIPKLYSQLYRFFMGTNHWRFSRGDTVHE
jgi:hypothetical protein